MKKHTDQQLAANYMGALAHLLSGGAGRHVEFIDKVELIISGSEPHAMQLMQFNQRVRQTGRPVIWIHIAADVPNVPQIGLVARSGEQVFTIEYCCLWSTPNGRTTHLVPDNFKTGSFVFDDELRLQHRSKAPAGSFKAAEKGMIRAYSNLRRLEAEQLRRGDEFILPQLARTN